MVQKHLPGGRKAFPIISYNEQKRIDGKKAGPVRKTTLTTAWKKKTGEGHRLGHWKEGKT